MFVRFSTSFRGRLPFRTRDIFGQSTCLSHLYSKVAKVPKYSMRARNISAIIWVLDTNGRMVIFRLFFSSFFLAGVVFVCFIWCF